MNMDKQSRKNIEKVSIDEGKKDNLDNLLNFMGEASETSKLASNLY